MLSPGNLDNHGLHCSTTLEPDDPVRTSIPVLGTNFVMISAASITSYKNNMCHATDADTEALKIELIDQFMNY